MQGNLISDFRELKKLTHCKKLAVSQPEYMYTVLFTYSQFLYAYTHIHTTHIYILGTYIHNTYIHTVV